MNKYRICKNDYGYYKIQMWVRPTIWLGFTIMKGFWDDVDYEICSDGMTPHTECNKFISRKEAEKQMKWWIDKEARTDNSYKEVK